MTEPYDITIVSSEDIEEWSAIYLNGRLYQYGDHYLVNEALETIVGVKYLDANFLLGTDRDAANTLDEILEYTKNKDEHEKQARVTELREAAERLLREAAQLER